MKETKLKEYLENEITAELLIEDLKDSQKKTSFDVVSVFVESIEIGEFKITKNHLNKIVDDFLDGKFSAIDINPIAFALITSDYFYWGTETKEGEIIADILFDWDNPEINYPLTIENFKLWKDYLKTGENKLAASN